MSREYQLLHELRPQAMRAWFDLGCRLADADDEGRPAPCRIDPAPFTSEDRAERREAALACAPCPVLIECARFALVNGEGAYVWGGVDLSPCQGRPAGRARLLELLEVEGVAL